MHSFKFSRVSSVMAMYYLLLAASHPKHGKALANSYNFTPASLHQLEEGQNANVTLAILNCSDAQLWNFTLTSSDEVVVDYPMTVEYTCDSRGVTFEVNGKLIGFTTLSFHNGTAGIVSSYFVGVIRKPSIWDDVFNYLLMVIIIINSFGFGAALDLKVLKQDLKRPIAIALGLCAQFVLMPILGFGLTKLFDATTLAGQALALGVFATAVGPGGGASNIWCLLLDADADLSIIITFISTVLCLGMIPMWFYTLGTLVVTDNSFVIPFGAIGQAVALATVPIVLGLPISRFLPRAAAFIEKTLPPFSLVIIIILIGTGVYANLYSFILLARAPMIAVCATVLPYSGLLIGFLLGLVFRQPQKRVKTLAIEAMVKNVNIAVLILRYSLAQPWADYSSAVPLAFGNISVIPTALALIARGICICRKRKSKTIKDNIGNSEITLSSTATDGGSMHRVDTYTKTSSTADLIS